MFAQTIACLNAKLDSVYDPDGCVLLFMKDLNAAMRGQLEANQRAQAADEQ